MRGVLAERLQARGFHGSTDRSGKRIAEAAAKPKIHAESDEVGERLEEDVRVDAVSPEVQINGEVYYGEIEWERDGELYRVAAKCPTWAGLAMDGEVWQS